MLTDRIDDVVSARRLGSVWTSFGLEIKTELTYSDGTQSVKWLRPTVYDRITDLFTN